MVLLLFFGMNIAFSFAMVSCIGYAILVTPDASIGLLRTSFFTAASNYAFSVIPMFVLMGEFSFRSGLSGDLYEAGNKWLGGLPGGLACATVGACACFGAICGSIAATTATMGTISIPEMRARNYDDRLSAGAISVGGTLGALIPPSTTFIIYGTAASVSIGKLFASGILPGILCSILIILTIIIWCKISPNAAPDRQRFSWKQRFLSLKGLLGVILMFGVVFGGMFMGLFTVNEAAGVGAFAAGVFMILRRQMTAKNLKAVLVGTAKSSCMVYLVLMGANVMNAFLAVSGLPKTLASFVGELTVNRYFIFAAVLLLYLFLGCLMDGLAIILLTVPIFLPILEGLGFDAVWFGCIVVLLMQIAAITPPVGISCYVLNGTIKDISLSTIFRGILPFLIPLFTTILLVTLFPALATFLPTVLFD
jgi:tripartite ATP-independent transporter DctM subunit